MEKEFNLSEKIVEGITAGKTGVCFREDIKEFIKKIIEDAKQNRTVSAAREEDCVLLETLNLIIKERAGKDLI